MYMYVGCIGSVTSSNVLLHVGHTESPHLSSLIGYYSE